MAWKTFLEKLCRHAKCYRAKCDYYQVLTFYIANLHCVRFSKKNIRMIYYVRSLSAGTFLSIGVFRSKQFRQ